MAKLMQIGGRPGDAARRRCGAQAPVLRARLLQGAPQPQHPAHRLCRLRDHQEWRHRHLRADRALCRDPAPRCARRSRRFGAFIEVHVATPLDECERRDRKGLYKLAREGKLKQFTGIDDPYDVPEKPEVRLDTENLDVDYCAQQVILKLENMGLIRA